MVNDTTQTDHRLWFIVDGADATNATVLDGPYIDEQTAQNNVGEFYSRGHIQAKVVAISTH